MASLPVDSSSPARRARNDNSATGDGSKVVEEHTQLTNGSRADESVRRDRVAKDWRRDRSTDHYARGGDNHRQRDRWDESTSGGRGRDRFDHPRRDRAAGLEKARIAHEPHRPSFQPRRADSGWGNKGKSRAKDTVPPATRSLASRLEGHDPYIRRRERRDDESDDMDDEARERRIRRLKRRRRSAGLDSDVDEEELLAFEQSHVENAGAVRSRNGSTHVERAGESDNVRHRHRSPASTEQGVERQLDGEDERDDHRRRSGKGQQTWPRREDKRSSNMDQGHKQWASTHNEDHSPRRSRADRSYQHSSDERRRRSSREDSLAWRKEEGRGHRKLTESLRSKGSPARSVASGEDMPEERSRRRSPDARILRRRRSRSPSPVNQESEDKVKWGHGEELYLHQRGSESITDVNLQPDVADQVSGSHSIMIRARPDEVYDRVAQVGEGTYGQVFKAKSSRTGVIVALKKIRMESEKDGFPITAMREVKLLQGLRHENVVRLHEMMLSKNSIYMVFEYLQHDLNGVLAQASIAFTSAHLKSLAAQLLAGLAYLHVHSILHRDLKCSNLLLNNEGTLKLADFGLARSYTKQERAPRKRTLDYTNRVVTLWYRAPELLFGETSYGDAIDVWGAGCIFLELFARKPVFQGNDEIHQVQLLFALLGPVRSGEWPEADSLPWYDLVRPSSSVNEDGNNDMGDKKQRLRRLVGGTVSEDALDVAVALLAYNPHARLSAHDALGLPYFTTNAPHAEKPASLLQAVEGEWHEFESRRARRNAAAQALHAHVHREREQKQQQQKGPTATAVAISMASTSAGSMQEQRALWETRKESVNVTPSATLDNASMDDGEASA